MKNYLVLKYHILVLSVHLCVLPIVHVQALFFSVNILSRYSSAPSRRHSNDIKHILRYLCRTTNIGIFYSRESKQQLLGYADAEYFSDPYKGKSQTWYVFNYNGTVISWRSIKQAMVVTSSNHSEILAIHEVSRECDIMRNYIFMRGRFIFMRNYIFVIM